MGVGWMGAAWAADVVAVAVIGGAPAPDAEPVEVAPAAELQLHAATHLFPEAPAHHLGARHVGGRDSCVWGELRYMPEDDLLWVGRAGAGVDLFGAGPWDLTLGLFIGTVGSWSHEEARRILTGLPVAGTEVAVGVEGDRLFGRARWLGGIGPVDPWLSEHELTAGYKLLPRVHLFGQWVRVGRPGDGSGGLGLGIRAVL